jgi:hypothetical protein
MMFPACEECEGIRRALLELLDMSRRGKPGPGATPDELAAWFDERDYDDEGKLRRSLALASVKSRITEHWRLTGHQMPLPIFPTGLNFN